MELKAVQAKKKGSGGLREGKEKAEWIFGLIEGSGSAASPFVAFCFHGGVGGNF